MEIILEQKKEECLKLENQLKRVRSFSTNMMLHNHFPSFNTNLGTWKWIQLLSNWLLVFCQAQNATLEAQANTELAERIKNLEQEVARHKEDSGKAQAEVDRLLDILREMENEKNDKDKKINELERWVGTCTLATMSSSLALVFIQ